MAEADDALIALVTAALEEGERLARALVERRQAACVNLLPVRSIYRWQGSVADEAEVLLVIKTTKAGYSAVEAAVRELHSYQVPEVLALPLYAGSPPYLAWVLEQVQGPK